MFAEPDRLRLRSTFESAASRYHAARPDYPEELFDELVRVTGAQAGDAVLEIGCGTGKATIPLARRGFRVTALEIGLELAAEARRNLAAAGCADAEVLVASFEEWEPPEGSGFALVAAATSWHWADPAVRCRRAFDLLRPGGHLATWSATHVVPQDGDPFFGEIQAVYDEIGEGLPSGWVFVRPGELPDYREELEASGLFELVMSRQFDWELHYTAEEYIALLETFSGHIAMEQWQRDRLYGEIRQRLAERPDGLLRRHWGLALRVGRRLDEPEPGAG